MAEIFTRKFSEISGGRFDPQFYMQIFENNLSKIKQKKHEKIGNLVELSTQGYVFEKDKEQNIFQYIEISNIDIENGHIRDISLIAEKDAPSRARLLVKQDDILVSATRPNRGAIAIVPKNLDGAVASTGFIVIRKVRDKILKQYLAIILKTNISLLQFQQRSTGGNYPAITQDDFKKCLIPLPPIPTQQHIIDLMDKAYKAKQEKENKAKELLDSIDSYLLEELGIILPLRANNTLDSRIYTQKISALSGSRFDANYHQKYYRDLEKSLLSSPYPLVNLTSLINNFKKGIEVGSSEYSQNKEIPFIRVSDITNNGIDFSNVQKFISASLFENLKAYKPKENELLYSKDGTIGICLEADTSCDYIISGGILRLELKAEVDKDFLCFLLGSYMMNVFANRVSIGAVIKHLNIGEFLNLKIPLPPLALQTQIANRLKSSKFQALSLEKEAKEILHKAKIDIEALLLTAGGGGGVTLAFSFEAFISTQMYYFDKMTKIWNEKEYSVVKLKAITQNIQTGTTPHKNLNPYLQNTKIQFIRNSDIHNGEIALDDIKFIDESLKDLLTYSYKNEVLVCIAGTIGVSAVNNIGQLAINQNISSLKFCNDEVSSSFVCYWLNSKLSLEFFHRNATIATISYINNQTLLNLKIPLPPLTEQERIAKEISQRKARAKALKQEAKELLESAKKEVEHIILGG
ncbi:restriction endonuclease subunit S [Campylobacter upsaliensis]|uniref:restriction endonuclease subunit S n=3 Tax=Campylobacter upsaliensis TaxID=28080 RepID=UPI002B3BED68|nr:restriction endonuclease subunit S [Campylobacter upsaliensis]MEB2819661.1 restriction endonuclease subunit S [Campylobacter upsaliensis]